MSSSSLPSDVIKKTNGHNVHLLKGIALKKQTEACVKLLLDQIDEAWPDLHIDKTFRIAEITLKGGIMINYGYLYFADKRVVNMLVGDEVDGTPRVEEYDDPDWRPPSSIKPKVMVDTSFTLPPLPDIPGFGEEGKENLFHVPISWGDEAIENDSLKPRRLKRKLPPLATIPQYMYDDQQKEAARQAIANNDKERIGLKSSTERGSFECSRAYITKQPDVEQHLILCRDIPSWVDEDIIRPYVAPFNSCVSTTRETVFENGRPVTRLVNYPLITFKTNTWNDVTKKECWVTYSKETPYDGSFSLQINRKFTNSR